MSAHDHLASEAMRLKRLLEEYIAEHDPPYGHSALVHATQLIMKIDKFLEEGS